jgi:hypothetical protein
VGENKVKTRHHFNTVGLLLGFAHLFFAIWVYNQHYEGGWDSFPMAVLDFPITLILAAANRLLELSSNFWWFSYLLFGSVWWYLLGQWLTQIFSHSRSRVE